MGTVSRFGPCCGGERRVAPLAVFWSRNPAVPTPRRRRASAWRGEMGGEWNSLLNETASPCPIGHSFRKNSFFVREGKTPIPCEARRAAPGRRPFASLRNGMRRRTCPPVPSRSFLLNRLRPLAPALRLRQADGGKRTSRRTLTSYALAGRNREGRTLAEAGPTEISLRNITVGTIGF